jgi:hypothetical protein
MARPPRTFKTAQDVANARAATIGCRPWAVFRPRDKGYIMLGDGRAWCWRHRVVGLVVRHERCAR